jgi:hypothetical protein
VDENLIDLFPDVQGDAGADSVQAAAAECAAQPVHGHSHFGGNQRDWSTDGRVVRGFYAGG